MKVSAIVFCRPDGYNLAVARVGWCGVNRPLTSRERRILALMSFAALLVCGALFLLMVDRILLTPRASRVVVVSPPDGSLTSERETVSIRALATGQNLIRSELWADGVLVETITSPEGETMTTWPISHSWMAQGQGRHQFSVKVYDLSGAILASSPSVVQVVPPGRIAFATDRDGNYEIYTMRTDGRELARLTSGPEQEREPSCSSAGLLLFASTAIGAGTDIWVTDPGSQERMNLTASVGGDRSPRWAPDDDMIAFVSDRYGPSQVYLMRPDGSGLFQLTAQDSPVEQPSWAPDGSALLYAAERDGNWDVFSISVDEGTVERLTEDPAQDWYPAWSPRGDQIAFASGRQGSQQIYSMKADGTEPRRLTAFPSGAEQPQWSPDGGSIVFVAYMGRSKGLQAREIYIMRSDGSDPIRLTDNAFDDTGPVWCQ